LVGFTVSGCPAQMFLAVRRALARRWNVPNPESTTFSPRTTARATTSMSESTTVATSLDGSLVRVAISATNSLLFTIPPLGSDNPKPGWPVG
jgi:hypothetical protein